jgi:hypothetical protein
VGGLRPPKLPAPRELAAQGIRRPCLPTRARPTMESPRLSFRRLPSDGCGETAPSSARAGLARVRPLATATAWPASAPGWPPSSSTAARRQPNADRGSFP